MSDAVVLNKPKTLPLGFTLPVVGAAGAFFGLFVGAAQGSMAMGVAGGFVLCALIAWLAVTVAGVAQEKPFRWGLIAIFAIAGFMVGALPGLVVAGGTINSNDFSLSSLIVSFLGAVALLAIVNLVQRGSVR